MKFVYLIHYLGETTMIIYLTKIVSEGTDTTSYRGLLVHMRRIIQAERHSQDGAQHSESYRLPVGIPALL